MRYTVRHVTRFTYETPVTESVMEARMQPRSDGLQRCLHFGLITNPAARVMTYLDHEGNAVHHFDIPGRHSRLTVTAEALVDCLAPEPLPAAVGAGAWGELDGMSAAGEWFEYLAPSAFTRPTALLAAFARELALDRADDPVALIRRLMRSMRDRLEYRPRTTRVDSPIDEALSARGGVCQDFSHIFIALARQAGIPARYVSGYLFREAADPPGVADDATHAWVECFVPGLAWVGVDPTNGVAAGDGHVRVAVGRDYADVPPTRGVYKGVTAVRTELAVSVQVGSVTPALDDVVPFTPWMSRDAAGPLPETQQHQQQQQ